MSLLAASSARASDVVSLVRSLVMSSGSGDSVRQEYILTNYLLIADTPVGRSGFYAWFTMPLAFLLFWLLDDVGDIGAPCHRTYPVCSEE
jgi:hypothetical protein